VAAINNIGLGTFSDPTKITAGIVPAQTLPPVLASRTSSSI